MVETATAEDERARIAQRNRELMPETATIVDDFRRVFGRGVRLLWARENGIEVGKPSEERDEQR